MPYQLATVQTAECAEILKLLCVALLDDLRLQLEYDALGVANNPNPWTENSQQCD